MRRSVYVCSLTVMLCIVCLGIGVGVMVSQSSGARDTPLWSESRPTQVPVVQVPNFADMAEHRRAGEFRERDAV